MGKILVPNEEITTFLNSEDEDLRDRDRNTSDCSSDSDDESPHKKPCRRPTKATAKDDESDREIDYGSLDLDDDDIAEGEDDEIRGSTGYDYNYVVVW